MSRVVIAGGTGFIGSALALALDTTGHDVVILTRKNRRHPKAKVVVWNAKYEALGTWETELDGADAVINLSGSPVTAPWTDENKKKILDSRVSSTRAIGEAIAASSNPPPVWINGSATGFYGDRREQTLDESKPRGPGFLADVCVSWEEAVHATRLKSTRCIELRTGVVLGLGGGALAPLLKTTKAFMGGPLGDGKQWVPWIHLYDLVTMVDWLCTTNVIGPVNAVAPNPVRNAELMATLRKVNRRPWAPPIPKFLLALNSKLSGPDPSTLLSSTRAVPKVALDRGFEFSFATLEPAIRDLCT